MADTIFRTKVTHETQTTKPIKVTEKTDEVVTANVEPPYTEYATIHNHPFTVDYFQLGDTWRDQYGGFEKEVETIEGYFKRRIQQGELQDETKAVKEHLKKLYKLCSIDKNERVTMQIEKLAAYMEFINKTDDIKFNYKKYGNW